MALAWWKIYGFPFDPRLWVAFIVHDLGYIGKPNMDGTEGETHPELGARIMGCLFDSPKTSGQRWYEHKMGREVYPRYWHDFLLCHSRYYAKKLGKPFSRLCVADKLAFALTPRWLYLPMVHATGEIHEYLKMAAVAKDHANFKTADYRGASKVWHAELCRYMAAWVEQHKDGAVDTWTSTDRHARTDSGVWK